MMNDEVGIRWVRFLLLKVLVGLWLGMDLGSFLQNRDLESGDVGHAPRYVGSRSHCALR
jgi:hypothetical protein